MVGRTGEVSELVRAWSHVRQGSGSPPPTVIITGAAGLGKSLLAAVAVDAFTPRPRVVLTGRARVHSPAPYDWLAAVLSGRETGDLPVPADALAWLAQDPDTPTERYAPDALLRLAVRTVRALVGAGPALLVVEDLHALDPASLNLVAELAAAPDLPALLLVTSRPPEAAVSPEIVARTLARLAGVPGAVRAAEVAAVLAEVYPDAELTDETVRAVRDRTGGNPYWLTELLVARAGEGPEALAHEPMPEHLRYTPLEPERLLTAREMEVLDCLAAGMSNKQVARSLGISIRTVTVHVSNLLRKTGSASRTEAAVWALRNQVAGRPGIAARQQSTVGI
jgi:DNA-binding CsgD family transcriptional regulator